MAKPETPRTHTGTLPWIRLRSASSGPYVYKRMLGDVGPTATFGDLVAVYDKTDAPYGVGLYNPKSQIALRMLTRGRTDFSGESFFEERLGEAAALRRDLLKLDATTDAYRVVYGEGDGLSGLVVDKYADALGVEYYSLGMHRQRERILGALQKLYPGAAMVERASEHTQKMEGFRIKTENAPSVLIKENGVRFRVDLGGGHKTGFFCDQRDNRLALSTFTAGKTMLDVCSSTGGFGLYAKKLGGAESVTAVDLDPEAVAMVGKNAGLNQVRIEAVCADAYPYLRQAGENKRAWDVVVTDPHKLISNKDEFAEGRQKYYDLSRLALGVVKKGGLYIACSCSGMLDWEGFSTIVRGAAVRAGVRLQLLRKSGAGADHPIAIDFPEGEYLKVFWFRVT